MTILETERLVRKIAALPLHGAGQAGAEKLAEDFATACRSANLRLHQCEAMIREGDRHQAIQSAETPPNLLDWVTVLEFQGVEAWRDHCEKNGLAVGERIDERSVETLNECYAQGISSDHPLYAAYRRAVLLRNDEEALRALQSIVRLNPSDTNAAAELERFDAKVLITKLQHLNDLVSGADREVVLAEVEAIEAFGFKNRPDGEIWRKAQTIRCRRLLEELERLRSAALWTDALGKLDSLRRLQDEFKVELPPADRARLEEIETWARGEQEKDRSEREFEARLAELRYRLQSGEGPEASAAGRGLGELRAELADLQDAWHALGRCGRPLPSEVGTGFQKRSAWLEEEIGRRIASRRRATLVGLVAAGVAAVIILGIGLAWYTARNLAGQLNQAIEKQQFGEARRLIKRADLPHNRWLGGGTLRKAVNEGNDFVSREQAHLDVYRRAFDQLPKELKGVRPEEVSRRFDSAKNAFNEMVPELRTENQKRLETYEQGLKGFLFKQSGVANEELARLVKRAEEGCSQLTYDLAVETAGSQTKALSGDIEKIARYDTNQLNIQEDVLERAAAVQRRFAAYDQELKRLNGAADALTRAGTMDEYSNALDDIAASKFASSPWVKTAAAAQALSPNAESALRFLLGVTNESRWELIKTDQSQHAFIARNSERESDLFNAMNADPAIKGTHQRLRLHMVNSQGTKVLEWITAETLKETRSWTSIKVYECSSFPDSCLFTNMLYQYQNGKPQFTPNLKPDSKTLAPDRVDDPRSLTETAGFDSLGLEAALGSGQHTRPLLAVVEALKDARLASPLFRAYLFARLVDFMKRYPEQPYGLDFAPAIQAHRDQISQLVGADLNSGDWFVRPKVQRWEAPLKQFFDSDQVKGVSYTNQAGRLLKLNREIAKEGLRYVGFVALGGKATVIDGTKAGEVWGYSKARKEPVLLGHIEAGSKASLAKDAVELSPLFVLARTREEFLSAADVNRADRWLKDALPPLYRMEPDK